jgi:hypothetical protein
MNDPQNWQKAADALGMDVEIDPEKVHRMFDGVRNCGAMCKSGKPCGVWVHGDVRCWRHS